MLALQHANETLEAHARVDDVHLEFLQRAVGLTVVLHEHEVPNLDHLRIVLIDEFATRLAVLLFLFRTAVDVDFRAGTARTRVTHFPEIVVLVAVDDMIGGHMLQPIAGCLVVALKSLCWIALEYRHVEVFGIQFQNVNEILPSQIDGAFLEVVAKRPVAQHFEHGVVVGVVADLLKVVVLTTDAQALLCVGTTARFWLACAEYNVLPLVHACIGEHQCGIVLDYHRSRGHDGVAMLLKKLLVRLANLFCCHHFYLRFTYLRFTILHPEMSWMKPDDTNGYYFRFTYLRFTIDGSYPQFDCKVTIFYEKSGGFLIFYY